MTQLSLCMIVKDEADNLPRCLDSVSDLVDEIVVVDTGSTDNTIAIAQSYGAKIHHFEWNHNFSDARNESLKYATGEWILVLDADEVLCAEIRPAIERVIQQEAALVVNLLRQEMGAIQSPYSMVSRLFRSHPKICFNRPYHAMIDDSVLPILKREPQWNVVNLSQVALLHYGYTPDAIADRDKLTKARLTIERFLANHPGEPYACSKLGALYTQIGRVGDGIQLLERGLKSQPDDPGVRYELHYHLGIAYSQMKHIEQAAQHYRKAIQQPIMARLKLGAINNLGNLSKAAGDLAGAKMLYCKAIQIDPTFAVGHYNLGMVLRAMGQLKDASIHYQQAIALNPDYADAHQNLGVVLLKMGRVDEGLNAFHQAIALHEQRDPSEAERLRQGLREMGFAVT